MKISREDMEQRRIAAARDLLDGKRISVVARKYDVSSTSVLRWRDKARHMGLTSLEKSVATGRPRKLTPAQEVALVEMYRAGTGWTQDRFTALILREFGVSYDPDHVGRIIHRMGLKSA